MTETLTPGATTLAQLETLWRGGAAARLDRSARDGIDRAAALIDRAADGDAAVYGVNTGFGKLASVKIAAGDTAQLQRNLILSHCCGVGEALDAVTTRLMLALKLLSLGRGASGVRWGSGGLFRRRRQHGHLHRAQDLQSDRIPATEPMGFVSSASLSPSRKTLMALSPSVFVRGKYWKITS